MGLPLQRLTSPRLNAWDSTATAGRGPVTNGHPHGGSSPIIAGDRAEPVRPPTETAALVSLPRTRDTALGGYTHHAYAIHPTVKAKGVLLVAV